MNYLYVLNFIIPTVLLIVGFTTKKHPYHDIGSNGYSTPKSRESQKAWDYAQLRAPNVFIKMGVLLFVVLSIVTILCLIFQIESDNGVKLGNLIGFIGLCTCFVIVESELKKIN